MNYELVKELYKAGFPKIEHNSDDINKDYPTHITLSELIEACLEKQPKKYSNFTLNHTFVEADGGSGYLWEAYFDEGISPRNDPYESGSTPEEAVAKLYIALNK